MIFGYASWVLPRVLVPGPVEGHVPLLIHFSTHVERAKFYSILCLAITGLILGLLDSKRPVLWGAATGLPIGVFALVEAFLGLASHNLLGIELVMYAIFTIPSIMGALLGSFIFKRLGSLVRWEKDSGTGS